MIWKARHGCAPKPIADVDMKLRLSRTCVDDVMEAHRKPHHHGVLLGLSAISRVMAV